MGELINPTRGPVKGLTAAKLNSKLEIGKYHDGGGTGLFVLVDRRGSKFFVQRITFKGKRHEIGLGSFPTVSLSSARDTARTNKQLARDGTDPRKTTTNPNQDITFAEAANQYIGFKMLEFKNDKHKAQWRSTLETYAFPIIGAKVVRDITLEDILLILQPIWTSKTETASRLRGRIENILNWSRVKGFRDGQNPAHWRGNLSELLPAPFKIKKIRHHPAVPFVDMPRWWADLDTRKGIGRKALQFCTLTLTRSKETRGMRWDEVEYLQPDRAAELGCLAIWTMVPYRKKAGRLHTIPLQKTAVNILKSLAAHSQSEYVFASPKGQILSDMTLSEIMRRMHDGDLKEGRGYFDKLSKRPAVPHGLRSTFRGWASEKGYSREMVRIQLSQKVGDAVDEAYMRADMFAQRAAMMEDWTLSIIGAQDD
jgi:integrase